MSAPLPWRRVAVLGARGAIGGALVAQLAAGGAERVYALARGTPWREDGPLCHGPVDVLDETALAAAAARLADEGTLDAVIVATGALHAPGMTPEKSLRDLNLAALQQAFTINCAGPALAFKHFLPLLPRQTPGVMASLSARVGSIGDNRKGGWYGYRAAKAALNMVVRCTAIEAARRYPQAVIAGLHPGTVDSPLSQPFQGFVPAGQLFTPQQSASRLLAVLARLRPEDSGKCFAHDGTEIPP